MHKEAGGYRFLEHTTDAYVEAWATTLEEAFCYAARGMYETMLDPSKVEPSLKETLRVDGHDESELLYNWLEVILLRFDINGMVYSKFEIKPIDTQQRPLKIEADVKGEKYRRHKHGSKTEVKGVTYHLMEIQREAGKVVIRYLLDL